MDKCQKYKILIISNMYPSQENPSYGIFVKNFVEEIRKEFNVDLVVIKGREKNKVRKFFKYLVLWNKVLFKILFKKYDLVYVHYPSHVSIPLWLALKVRKVKFILNFHGDDAITHKTFLQKIFYFFLKKLVKKATLIVVPSSFFKGEVSRVFNINSMDKIYVYPSGGIDMSFFKPLPKDKCKIKLGFSPDDIVIGFVSTIAENKGWKVYLKVIERLHAMNSKVKGLMAGYGSEENKLFDSLEKQKVKSIINFLGKRQQKELPEIYNAMDVFVFPTLCNESLGLVGLEAMACGVPVVGSRLGGLQDYIKDRYNGFLCEPGNIDDFCKKILDLIEEKNLLENFSKNAYTTAKNFEKTLVNENLIKKLRQVISDEDFRNSRRT